ncbi:MAG: hypothetical protein J6B87_03395 [Clostridia bacterium]|nr:hypothetical protein [Clostridia bacterium]
MKYEIDQILYFKPTYNEETKECWICQTVKYIEKSDSYLAIFHDIYAPCHYMKGFVKENDLGDIRETFVLNVITLEELKIHMTIKEVMKLQYVDLYKN